MFRDQMPGTRDAPAAFESRCGGAGMSAADTTGSRGSFFGWYYDADTPSPTSTPNRRPQKLDGDSALRGRPLVGPKWRRLYAIAAQRLRAIEARSAASSSALRSERSLSEIATPTLTVNSNASCPKAWEEVSTALRTRSASQTASWYPVSGSRLANSSPPIRPKRSFGRS